MTEWRVSIMHTYKVLNDVNGVIEIAELHDKEILSNELKEKGKWPACLSPPREINKKCYEPHYSVSVHKHTDGEITTLYQAQFFVTDAECDTFIVEVFGEDTHLHNHEDSILDSNMLFGIAHTVEEIESILPQIEEQHDKFLGLGE
jgi:hypothetical protein